MSPADGNLPAGLPNYRLPFSFAYESTGSETRFTNIGRGIGMLL